MVYYGITTGGGLAFDSAGPVGVFLEVPWTYVINQQPYERSVLLEDSYAEGDPYVRGTPDRPPYYKQVLGLKMGMTFASISFWASSVDSLISSDVASGSFARKRSQMTDYRRSDTRDG